MRRICLMLLAFGLLMTAAVSAPAGEIIYITNQQATQGDYLDYLDSIYVDANVSMFQYGTLDADRIANMEAADLIIVARKSNSGDYDDGTEPAQWNALTTPLILHSNYLARNNRWKWLDGGTNDNRDVAVLNVDLATDPILAGITPDGLGQIQFMETGGISDLCGTDSIGNGTLIASASVSDPRAVVARWEPGTEFYTGAGQTPGGRRVWFAMDGDALTFFSGTDPGGVTSVGQTMLTNALFDLTDPSGNFTKWGDEYVWDGDTGNWGDTNVHGANSHWLVGGVGTPDVPTVAGGLGDRTVIAGGTASLAANQAAGSLQLDSPGTVDVGGNRLNLVGSITGDGAAKIGSGGELVAGKGGSIGTLQFAGTTASPATANLGGDTSAASLTDGGTAGVFQKTGAGTLTAEGVTAQAGTVFRISEGTFAGSGLNPLGNAETLHLSGGTFAFADAAINPGAAAANPVAGWKFDDEAGDSAVSAVVAGTNDGTLFGFPDDDSQWVEGVSGSALEFDGNDDYVEALGYSGVLGTASRTVTAWVKTTKNDAAIMAWGTNSAGQKWGFRVQDNNGQDGAIRAEVNGGYIVGSTDIRDDQWHHVAAVLSDDGTPNVNEILLYVDGQLEGVSASGGEPISTVSEWDVTLGNNHANERFSGRMDEAFIYDRALTADEIALMAGTRTPADLSRVNTLVTADSTINSSGVAATDFGSLALGAVLTTSGAPINFASTTITAARSGVAPTAPTLYGNALDLGADGKTLVIGGDQGLTLSTDDYDSDPGTLEIVPGSLGGGGKIELIDGTTTIPGGTASMAGAETIVFGSGGIARVTVGGSSNVISINFRRESSGVQMMNDSDIAGLVPAAFWNNAGRVANAVLGTDQDVVSPVAGEVVDATGAVTPVTLSHTSDTSYSTNYGTDTGDDKMMRGYLDDTNGDVPAAEITLDNIPFANYDLIVYLGSDGGNRSGRTSIDGGTTENWWRSMGNGVANRPSNAGYIETNALDEASATQGNYQRYDGLSGSVTVQNIRQSNNNGFFGLQIVNADAPTPGALNMSTVGVVVEDDADLDVLASGIVPFDTLTLNNGALAVNGGPVLDGISFVNGTTIAPAAGVTELGINTNVPVDLGSITATGVADTTLYKTGVDDVVLNRANTNVDGLTFESRGGTLGGQTAETGENPFGAGKLKIGGGDLVLSANSTGAATFNNPLEVAASGSLVARKLGVGVDMATVTLGGAVSVADGQTLSVSAEGNYSLNLAGAVTGAAGTVEATAGTINFGAAVDLATLNVSGGDATLAVAPNITDVMSVSDGSVTTPGGTVANLTVSGGVANTAGNDVAIGTKLKLADVNYGISGGGSLAVRGPDLLTDATVTVVGGILRVGAEPQPYVLDSNKQYDVLFISRNTNGTDSDQTDEDRQRERILTLANNDNVTVTFVKDETDPATVVADALFPGSLALADYEMIYLSNKADNNTGNNQWGGLPYPMVVSRQNAYTQSSYKMATGAHNTGGQSYLTILDDTHPITAGVPLDRVLVANSRNFANVDVGQLPAGAVQLGAMDDGDIALFVIEAGGQLTDGSTTDHVRIGTFFHASRPEVDGEIREWGLTLFDQTFLYAMGEALPVPDVDQSHVDLVVTGNATVDSIHPLVSMRNLTVAAGVTVTLNEAVYTVADAGIGNGATVDGELVVRGALNVGNGIGAMNVAPTGILELDGATYNAEVSLANLSSLAADKIVNTVAGGKQGNIYMTDGKLAPKAFGRTVTSTFTPLTPLTIIDNTAGGILETPFAEVTTGSDGHIGQGAFLRGPVIYDPAFGTPTVKIDVVVALEGDVDGDGLIGLDDWDAFRGNFGSSGADWTQGNFDSWSDITVDLDDWDVFRSRFGQTYPIDGAASAAAAVPEPGTIVMLLGALAGLAVLGWRRR